MMNHPADNKPLVSNYLLVHAVLLIGIVWGFQLVPSGWFEVLNAQITSDLLNAVGFSSSWGIQQGQAYVDLAGGVRNVSATIIRECTGLHVFAMFAGLVLPLRGRLWLKKTLSLLVSGLLLFVLNLSRLTLTLALTAFDVPPFAWIFTNPTVETYHYPLSFIYGLVGVAILVVVTCRWTLPELGTMLFDLLKAARTSIQTTLLVDMQGR